MGSVRPMPSLKPSDGLAARAEVAEKIIAKSTRIAWSRPCEPSWQMPRPSFFSKLIKSLCLLSLVKNIVYQDSPSRFNIFAQDILPFCVQLLASHLAFRTIIARQRGPPPKKETRASSPARLLHVACASCAGRSWFVLRAHLRFSPMRFEIGNNHDNFQEQHYPADAP